MSNESLNSLQQIYGTLATNFSRELLTGKKVMVKQQSVDIYGRKVVKVLIDEVDLSLLLVKEGWARVAYISLDQGSPFYTSNFSYYQDLLTGQLLAFTNRLGIWQNPENFKDIFPT